MKTKTTITSTFDFTLPCTTVILLQEVITSIFAIYPKLEEFEFITQSISRHREKLEYKILTNNKLGKFFSFIETNSTF